MLKEIQKIDALIKGGYLIDLKKDSVYKADILIKKGIIESIKKDIETYDNNFLKIDASGLYISPSFFDMHVHIREPGFDES